MPHSEVPVAAAVLNETAHAKINLALHVRARREDGYHALESLFVFAEDGDGLAGEMTADGAIRLMIDGPFGAALSAGEDNLVVRAARGLQALLGERRGAVLRLTKNLPVASGIGGGSADAAACLRLLTAMWEARVDPADLARLALALGSDVPACLASRTLMVSGRGETVGEAPVDALAGAPLLLVNPSVPLSTGSVFGGWDGVDRGPLTAEGWVTARNDLEAPAMAIVPVIADILAALRAEPGVRVARMSGSGATCFALFADAAARHKTASAIAAAHPDWWCLETRIRADG